MADSQDKEPRPRKPRRGKPRCGALRRDGTGETCRRGAGAGTSHPGSGVCKLHGGSTPNHVASEQRKKAVEAVNTFGLPREIEPAAALLEEVYRTAGIVSWIELQVQALDPAALVWGVTEKHDKGATEFSGVDVREAAVPNVWLDLYQKERKHLVDVCKAALAAGVAERQVRMAEQMGQQIVGVMTGVLTALGLDPGSPAVLAAIKAELSKAAGVPEGSAA